MPRKYEKVIFVCTGNTCRSPMAEALLKNLIQEDEIEIQSRGLIVLFSEPINPKSEEVLKNHNIAINGHTTKQFKASEVTESTLILTMTYKQKLKLMLDYGIENNIYSIKEYVGEIGDVGDPYGGTVLDYEECFEELALLVKKTMYQLIREV
jgi:protein-tyrosine-phosphatase